MATITVTKQDDYTIKVSEQEDLPPVKEVIQDLKFLKSQLIAVQAQKDAFIAARNLEIDNLKFLIAEAKRLNIKERNGN